MNSNDIRVMMSVSDDDIKRIVAMEKLNDGHRNVYYELSTMDAMVYPEDDFDGIAIRPLRTRFLRDGHRIGTDFARLLAECIEAEIKNLNNQEANNNDTETNAVDSSVRQGSEEHQENN